MWNIRLKAEGDTLTSVRTQYARDNIMQQLSRMRAQDLMPQDRPGLGRWALSIPEEDWLRLSKKYPDLTCRDAQIRTKAMEKFIQSEESKPYRLRGRV